MESTDVNQDKAGEARAQTRFGIGPKCSHHLVLGRHDTERVWLKRHDIEHVCRHALAKKVRSLYGQI